MHFTSLVRTRRGRDGNAFFSTVAAILSAVAVLGNGTSVEAATFAGASVTVSPVVDHPKPVH